MQRTSIQGKEEAQDPAEDCEVLSAWGSKQQATSKLAGIGLGFSQPQGTRARCQGIRAQPGSASVFFVSWNEPFNALGLIYWGGGNFDKVFESASLTRASYLELTPQVSPNARQMAALVSGCSQRCS